MYISHPAETQGEQRWELNRGQCHLSTMCAIHTSSYHASLSTIIPETFVTLSRPINFGHGKLFGDVTKIAGNFVMSRPKTKYVNHWKQLMLFTLLLSGDINVNPGPKPTYLCGYCQTPVTWHHTHAVCCGACDVWYHSDCIDLSNISTENLQSSERSWKCCKCDSCSIDSFIFHSYELNQPPAASMSPSTDSSFEFEPNYCSSPISDVLSKSSSAFSKNTVLNTCSNFRILSINFQSAKNKVAELALVIKYVKPDLFIGCETWFNSSVKNAEVFPEGYNKNVIRHDRDMKFTKKKDGGGVIIAARDELSIIEINTKC